MNYFPRVFLKSKEEKEISQGFPWVFDNEISHIKIRQHLKDKPDWINENFENCSIEPGTPVEVYTKAGGFLGTGIFNKNSKITVRLISSEHGDIVYSDIENFWQKRISDAYNIRQIHYKQSDSYRLIFAEADFVPGFICERYCDQNERVFLVVQFLSMSCEIFRKEILSALEKICSPYGIYERSDADVRIKEGLELKSGWIGKDTNLSVLAAVSIGDSFIQYGIASSNANIEKCGYLIVNSYISDLAGLDLRTMCEIYPLVVHDNSYYPHFEKVRVLNGNTVWAWTIAQSIKLTQDENSTLYIDIDFPLGLTHYVILAGINPFRRIQIYNMDFRTDPQFEIYNSSGYVYRSAMRALLLKSRHKSQHEIVKLFYRDVTQQEIPQEAEAETVSEE